MSKAFTKDDDDAGFVPPSSSSIAIPPGPFKLTATGARILSASTDPRIMSALARAEILPPRVSPAKAAVGITVRVRDAGGTRDVRLVMPEEQALLGEGCSIQSPLGRALLGAEVGDVRELHAPKGVTELEILELMGE